MNEPDVSIVTPNPEVRTTKRLLKLLLITVLLGMIGLFVMLWYGYTLNQPPQDKTVPITVTVEPGSTAKSVASQLKVEGVIQSDFLLYLFMVLFFEPTNIKASSYVFETPLSTYHIAQRLTEGDFDSDLVSFTHIEGERVARIAERAEQQLTNFDTAAFLALAEPAEGKLYPETYFIPADFTAEQLFQLMRDTFDKKLAPLQAEIEAHPLSLYEIITLASIIEREANSPESMNMVSGILQNRLEIDMPLQADASIEYILDKPLQELVPEDLSIDSPYNTYLNRGLPPTPIGNPGLTSIEAVLRPTPSEFLFYITGNDGNFYYAVTYDEHRANIERYLR